MSPTDMNFPDARPTSGSERAAFTVLELLVTIAAISLLLALLAPAVQRVRESARKTGPVNSVRLPLMPARPILVSSSPGR